MKNILFATIILLSLPATATAAPFANGDSATGKRLFEEHKCSTCHTKMLGGDGSKIFTRAEHKVKTAQSLATQITTCSVNLGLTIFPEDEEHLGAYLNNNYYHFK
jgi:cytochrome c2